MSELVLKKESESLQETPVQKNLIEAALFMAAKPLFTEELMRITGIGSMGYLKNMLREMQKEYSGRGTEIAEGPEGWQMQVKKEYLPHVANLTPHAELSDGCKKTLAMVIYKEPIKQSELVKMQGNKIYTYVKELEKKGLLRSEKKGHTKILKAASGLESYFGETKEEIKKRIYSAVEDRPELQEETKVPIRVEAKPEKLRRPRQKKVVTETVKEETPELPTLKELTVDDLK